MKQHVPGWADLEAERAANASLLNGIAQVIGWLATAAGAAVTAGWWVGSPVLAALVPGQQAVSPNTGVGIGLAGLTLVAVTRGWSRWAGGVAAVAVFVIGAVTVVEFLLSSTWSGFDHLLAEVPAHGGNERVPGRMGANVAADFVVLGIAGILLARGRAPNTRQWLAAAVDAVTIVALVGYALGVPLLSGHGGLTGIGMAPATAVAQLALGVGFLVAMPDRGWAGVFTSPLAGGRIARVAMPSMLFVILVILLVTHRLPGDHELAEQLGIAATVLVVVAAVVALAVQTDRLDQDRLRQAAAAVDRSERRYRLGFEGSPVGIAVLDSNGTALEVNQALAAMIGKPAESIVGRESIASLSVPGEVPANLAVQDRIVSGVQPVASLQTAMIAADGRRIPIKVDASRVDPMNSDADPVVFLFITDLSEIDEKNQQLAYLAERDPLTRVLNRRGFLEHVQEALDKGAREGRSCAVLFVDIDGFKMVNDVYGHRIGDRFLSAVADRLAENTRADHGEVGRLGGDEFAVLVPACRPSEVPGVARRLERSVREPLIIDGVTLAVSCSIGHAVSGDSLLDAEELMARADQDMYAIRRARAGQLAGKVEELRTALDSGQLVTHLQPIWTLGPDGLTLHGYEALLRWNHPDRGLTPPDEFIHTAEEGGLIHRLDLWAGIEALRKLAAQPGLSVAINCSALTLTVPGMAHELIGAVKAVNRDPTSVIVELTESVDIPDSSQIMKSLNELRHEGILIALDDFGAGYAGLNNLRTLPIDIVKIDRSLIATLADDSDQSDNTEHFLTGIRQLTHAMGTQLLAEGIENTRQLDLVRRLGFDYVQGFLLGAPQHDHTPAAEPAN